MVYFQVEEIDKKFLHFAELEKNQWTETTECVKAAKLRRSKVQLKLKEKSHTTDFCREGHLMLLQASSVKLPSLHKNLQKSFKLLVPKGKQLD